MAKHATPAPQPLRFWGPPLPTSREVADTVARAGADALTNAQRRADAARYQEVRCRSALNRVKGMPFQWTINPYRGCTHGCHYCFARRYHAQFAMDADDQFSSVILVKTNIAEMLGREVDRPSWTRRLVAIGTATDAYQPIEGHYRLTRASLVVLARAATPVNIVTKGPMIVRDLDVLRDAARGAGCTVCMSVPTVDEAAWQALEPGTAHPLQRLRAVKALNDAGIPAGVLVAPIVPGFTASRRQLEETISACADCGARFVGYSVMHLQPGTREHFLTFVEKRFPAVLPKLEQLYASPYAPRAYRERVGAYVRVVQRRFGLAERVPLGGAKRESDGTFRRADSAPPAGREPAEQVAFQW